MARVTIEDALAYVHDQFALVHLAAQRYRQLHRGAPRLVECDNKNIVTAIREVAAGKVRFREDVHSELMHPHAVRSNHRRNYEPSQEFMSEMNNLAVNAVDNAADEEDTGLV